MAEGILNFHLHCYYDSQTIPHLNHCQGLSHTVTMHLKSDPWSWWFCHLWLLDSQSVGEGVYLIVRPLIVAIINLVFCELFLSPSQIPLFHRLSLTSSLILLILSTEGSLHLLPSVTQWIFRMILKEHLSSHLRWLSRLAFVFQISEP